VKLRLTTLCVVGLCFLANAVFADTVKGRIKYISNKASSIQIDVTGKAPVVVKFDSNTQFVGAKDIKDLSPPDLIEVEYAPGEPATRISMVVFGIPKELEIDAAYLDGLMRQKDCFTPVELEIGPEEVERLMQRPEGCVLIDARPTARYQEGHIPRAVSIYAKDLPDKVDLLPKDKSKLIIFYCGGPTCPFTGESIKIAEKEGYTNLKGFQGGMPAWKKSGRPVHASAAWVAESLDQNHVIIDVRPESESSRSHIKTAVSMPSDAFKAMTESFIKEQKKARLPGVSDMGAPILLYGNGDLDLQVLDAYAELRKWGYKDVAILEGGFDSWLKQGRVTASGPAGRAITYVRKLKPGAIAPENFVQLEKSRKDVLLVDVRAPQETAKGTLKGEGAIAIPLDQIEGNLAKLPKDKEIVTYCSNGIRSEMAFELLKSKGYNRVEFLNETIAIDPAGEYRLE
jgi:rhodanese-related sulfurtransferase